MLIGYARISTDDQHLHLQRDALQQAGCTRIYQERVSGAKAERPGLSQLLEVARSGDVVVVWRLDRLDRALKDLIQTVEVLENRGIKLHSLQEAIATSSSGGKLIFHLFGTLAEFEPQLIQELTQAGLVAARARGRLGGSPKALDPTKRQLAVQLYNERKHKITEICQMMGISKPTLYNYIEEASS